LISFTSKWITTHMALRVPAPNARAEAESWAVDRAVSLPEVWGLVAACRGLVGAWRLLGVCRAARTGVKEFLGTLPRLVVSGGYTEDGGGTVSEVWGLDLATMRWEAMPALLCARQDHACCAVRGAVVVLGGAAVGDGKPKFFAHPTSRVEMLSKGEGGFVELPPLSCGAISGAAAIAVDESQSALGQVLLLGGIGQDSTPTSSVRLVDLATGVCTPQADLLQVRSHFAAAQIPDGSIVCAGSQTVELWGWPVQGALNAVRTGRELPSMSVGRFGCSGCVLSDGRFAVLGGFRRSLGNSAFESSCEALTIGGDERWSPLQAMHDSRNQFACATVAGCVIAVGGNSHRKSAEVYDEVLGRWLRLPHDLPHDCGLDGMSAALL
jgi:hypothetical protein